MILCGCGYVGGEALDISYQVVSSCIILLSFCQRKAFAVINGTTFARMIFSATRVGPISSTKIMKVAKDWIQENLYDTACQIEGVFKKRSSPIICGKEPKLKTSI